MRYPGEGAYMTFSLPLLALALCSVSTLWAVDPVLGTWNLNLAKSKYFPGPAPKQQTRIYEADSTGVRATVMTVSADGQTITMHYPANYDGKEHTVTGSPDSDGIVMRKVDDYTADSTLIHAGVVIGKARRVVSPDGKTMTITYQGESQGEKVSNTGFYEKK